MSGIENTDFEFYEDEGNWNSILNLAFLDANENKSKQAKQLSEWVAFESERQGISEKKFCNDHLLPDGECLSFSRFREFISERRRIVGEKLRILLQA
jgi:hypothetical protein